MKKAILYSAGLDSTVMLYHLVDLYGKDNVIAISVDFGQDKVKEDEQGNSFGNNVIEKNLIKKVTDKLGVQLEMITLPYFEPVLDFMKKRIEKEKDFYKISKLSLFPARNYIMMYSAACVAEMLGCDELFIGIAKTDYIGGLGNPELSQDHLNALNKITEAGEDFKVRFVAGFPVAKKPSERELLQEKLNRLNKALMDGTRVIGESINSYEDVKIDYPLLSKAEEVKRGVELGVDFKNEVWTCLHPKLNDKKEYIQCGNCKTCIRNRAAFISAGVKDPFEYEHKELRLDSRTFQQMILAGDDVSMFSIEEKRKKD